MRERKEKLFQKQAEALRVRMATIEQPVRELSGGNQQKVALAKWLLANPELFILDEPTHGIDVATKAEIHRLIADWKRQGKTVLLISSELEELQQLCDRIVVMRQGKIVGEFEPTASQTQILEAAFGRVEFKAESKPVSEGRIWRIGWMRFFSRELSLLLFIALVALVVGMKNRAFVTGEHWLTLVQESAPMLIGASAIAMVILSGNLDLSVGSVLGACAMAAGHAAKAGLPLPVVILLALGLGAAIGAFNGLLVTRLSIPSIIVTLGMMGIVRGTMIVLTKGYWVIGLPESFRWLGTGKLLSVPVPIWVSLTTLLLVWFLLRQTNWGRDLYAIGNNLEAARLAGIPVRKRLFSVFVACGLLISLAALVYAARFPVVQSETGKGFELDVITAAVFGGVNIFGGAGSVIGAALGAFAVTVLHSALTFMQLAGEWDKFALGGLILLSVVIDSVRQRRQGAS
jgi:ribose/xylose/arabinose/galactoside ABC-type transport system permease subunit